MRDVVRQWVNVFSAVATVVINALANLIPLNGQNTGEISDRFDVLFVPAGYVFAIWGLIYAGLIAFAIYQALPNQRANPRLRRVGYLFALSCVANVTWLFLWHYELFSWTLLAMIALLLLLIFIYLRLQIGRVQVPAGERWAVHLTFSLYLGWITVATIANVSDVLYLWGWDGWGLAPEFWAVIMLAVAAGIALAVTLTRGDVAYLLVLVWAFIGIAVKQADVQIVFIAALVTAGLVLLMALVALLRSRRGHEYGPTP